MKKLCESLSSEKLQTTVYHPQSNGTVERMHGILKGMLSKAVTKGKTGCAGTVCSIHTETDAT